MRCSPWSLFPFQGLAVPGLVVLVSCGGGGGSSPQAAAPRISAQPQSVNVALGAPASFQVTAASTAPLSYQWERSNDLGQTWTALAGSSGSSLELAAVTTSDQNAQFQVQVTNSGGTATSAPATLTVTAAVGSGSVVSQEAPASAPLGIVQGPDGNIWFTNSAAGQVCVLDKLTHQVVRIPLADAHCDPVGIANGPDGNLWFTEQASDKVGVITPAGTVTHEFPVGKGPTGLVAGADGDVWFTMQGDDLVGRITPEGIYAPFAVTTPAAWPTGITRTQTGVLWFTEMNAAQVAKITSAGAVTEFQVSPPPGGVTPRPQGITSTSDGSNTFIWYADTANNLIAKFTAGAQVAAAPAAPGGAGALTQAALPPALTGVTYYPLGTGANTGPASLAVDAGGNVWVAEQNSGAVAVITPATAPGSTPTTYPLPTASGQPGEVVICSDGNLWVTVPGSDSVVQVVASAPASTVSVSVSPAAAVLNGGMPQWFQATVLGAPDETVTWSVPEAGGGTITPSGLYTAAATIGTYHVVATSKADPARAATATVSVTSNAAPAVTP